ncbi:MAG TPA: hypothetical protein VG848_00980 [Acetobacteraceae bacterium]|jgi:hypothetical protein|nr:hypothetical protein [Acetobacteraceae bacterium]
MRPWALLAALLPLSGCNSVGTAAGAVAGLASGSGTANPALGAAVGLGTKAAVDSLVKYIGRERAGSEQDAIAEIAGTLPVGGTAPWKIRYMIPIGDEHGTLRVVRTIDTPLAACREIVFTVIDGKERAHYVTTECHDGTQWRWALAEPATSAWGFLQ